jgi:ABC-type glutathione transport system ATPase component
MSDAANTLLNVERLSVVFDDGKSAKHRDLEEVSLTIHEGEVVGFPRSPTADRSHKPKLVIVN